MVSADFLLGGCATFSLAIPPERQAQYEGRTHYTWKMKAMESGAFWCGLLTGPDNESDYTSIGVYNPAHAKLYAPKKSPQTATNTPFKWLAEVIRRVLSQEPIGNGFTLHHEGRCGVCGRKLTDPESIECGIGPICRSGGRD